MTTNSDGKEQCEVCHRWFYWEDLTCKQEGVWSISCCFPCSKMDKYFDQIIQVESGPAQVKTKTVSLIQQSLF